MSGVLFVIGIPTESEENTIRRNNGLLTTSNVSMIKKSSTSPAKRQRRRTTSFKFKKNSLTASNNNNNNNDDDAVDDRIHSPSNSNHHQKIRDSDLLESGGGLAKADSLAYGTFSTNNLQNIQSNRHPMVKFNEQKTSDLIKKLKLSTQTPSSPSPSSPPSSPPPPPSSLSAIVTINRENEKTMQKSNDQQQQQHIDKQVNGCRTDNNKVIIIGDDINPSLDIPSDASMELVMIELIKKMHIENVIWQKSKSDQFYQITFTLELNCGSERYNQILVLFSEWGIGERNGSFLSILPCSMYCHKGINNLEFADGSDDGGAGGAGGGGGGTGGGCGGGGTAGTGADDTDVMALQKQSAWNRFVNSTRARFNVAQIILEVKQDAQLTFDFVTCLIVAGILAAFGLIENSTIFLASSMLISPLMGPIIATIFGTVVKDRQLVQIGFVNEMIGILLATFVGFLFSLLVYSIGDVSNGPYPMGGGITATDNGMLTTEMLSRCEFHSLIIGIFTALPSGAAVAIAILGENIGSLVGVAISASLLPPAVNAGLIWGLSILNLLHQNDDKYKLMVKTLYWTGNQPLELLILGSISMLLTIINVICIYVMGIIFLKIKEVAPIVSPNHRQFWKYDIKAARDFNKSSFDEEFAEFAENVRDTELSYLVAEQQQLRNLNRSSYQSTWSPMTHHRYLLNGGAAGAAGGGGGGGGLSSNGIRRDSHSSIHINVPSAQQQPQQFDYNYQHYYNNKRKLSLFGNGIGSGSYKTIIGKSWSPPHKSILIDQIFPSDKLTNHKLRRTSMPGFNNHNNNNNNNHHHHHHHNQQPAAPPPSLNQPKKTQFIPMTIQEAAATGNVNSKNSTSNSTSLLTNTLRNNAGDYNFVDGLPPATGNNKLEKITEATQSQLRRAQSISPSICSTSTAGGNENVYDKDDDDDDDDDSRSDRRRRPSIVKKNSTEATKKRKKFIVTSISESHLK